MQNNSAFSFPLKGSSAWTTKAITPVVTIQKIKAKRVRQPSIIKMGAINSPNTVKIKDGIDPTPRGSAKSKLPLIYFINFPQPCVIKQSEKETRKNNKAVLV